MDTAYRTAPTRASRLGSTWTMPCELKGTARIPPGDESVPSPDFVTSAVVAL